MNIIDILIIIAYFIMLVLIGLYVAKKHVRSGNDAAVAGRSLGAFMGGIGKAANSAGGSTSVGGTSWGYQLGIAAVWYSVGEGLAYWAFLWLVKRQWRALFRSRANTVGSFFGYRWGKFGQAYVGIINTISYVAFVAAQIIATATVIKVLMGWDYNVSLFVSTGIIIFYCAAGGLRAIVLTDVIQMAIIIVGMLFVLPPIIFKKAGDALGGGGLSTVWDTLKNTDVTNFMTHLDAPGVFGWLYVIGAIVIPCLLIGICMQAPYQYQASIKSADAAFKSYLSVPILYIPAAIMVVLIGMCAVMLYGADFMPAAYGGPADGSGDPNMVLPTIIKEFLPTGLVGLLLAAVLSATMSTSSTCLICATTSFTDDVVNPFLKKKLDNKKSLLLFRCSMVGLGFSTILITLWANDIIKLITETYAAAVSALAFPIFMTLFWKKATKVGTFTTMIASAIIYYAVQFGGDAIGLNPNLVAAPLFVAFPASVVIMLVVSFATQKTST
ncbi:MAG: sodium:solute symporter family protein, partial [Clostridiales Family XIII bacterium]|nr:sodium:solute symporter family protein [Clostridiales Family XIII bacterium]